MFNQPAKLLLLSGFLIAILSFLALVKRLKSIYTTRILFLP
jgi:hypothetical protein